MIRTSCILLVISLVILPLFSPIIPENKSSVSTISQRNQYETHDAILIDDDFDLDEQGWLGSGTPEDPYVIEGLSIISEEVCVSIMNTDSHLVIRDCYLWSRPSYRPYFADDGVTLILQSAKNVRVVDCVIEAPNDGVIIESSVNCSISRTVISYYSSYGYRGNGIVIEESSRCNIIENTITGWDQGLRLHFSDNCSIFNNSIVENEIGLDCYESNQNVIINNTIARNEDLGIAMSGSDNIIYANKIGINEDENVGMYTDQFNQWDDNVSYGNGWDDYEGEGNYTLGIANVDRYPWMCSDFDFTIVDVFGPEIEHTIWLFVTMTPSPYHPTHHFRADCTDASGVDSVYVYYSYSDTISLEDYTPLKMEKVPTEYHPDRYQIDLEIETPYYGDLYFYYWANDSLGNQRSTSVDHFFWRGSSPLGMVIPMIAIPLGIVGLLGIVFLFMQKTKRTIPSQISLDYYTDN